MFSVQAGDPDDLDRSEHMFWHLPLFREALREHRKWNPRLRRIGLLPRTTTSQCHHMKERNGG